MLEAVLIWENIYVLVSKVAPKTWLTLEKVQQNVYTITNVAISWSWVYTICIALTWYLPTPTWNQEFGSSLWRYYENLSKVTLVYGTIHLMIPSSQSWDNWLSVLHLLYLQLSLLRQRGLNLRHRTFTHLSIIFFDMWKRHILVIYSTLRQKFFFKLRNNISKIPKILPKSMGLTKAYSLAIIPWFRFFWWFLKTKGNLLSFLSDPLIP